mmetsp:Transcript_77123/g.223183  ORF Transcript_77123/g.223183 Transcript_77123/m.223183 type:complete len:235 (+) Transcript_77123:801-1505(+)
MHLHAKLLAERARDPSDGQALVQVGLDDQGAIGLLRGGRPRLASAPSAGLAARAQFGGDIRPQHGAGPLPGQTALGGLRAHGACAAEYAAVALLEEANEVVCAPADARVWNMIEGHLEQIPDGVLEPQRHHAWDGHAPLGVAASPLHHGLEALPILLIGDERRERGAFERLPRPVHQHARELRHMALHRQGLVQVDDDITHHVEERGNGGLLALPHPRLHRVPRDMEDDGLRAT